MIQATKSRAEENCLFLRAPSVTNQHGTTSEQPMVGAVPRILLLDVVRVSTGRIYKRVEPSILVFERRGDDPLLARNHVVRHIGRFPLASLYALSH